MSQRSESDGLTRRQFVKAGVTAAAVAGLSAAAKAEPPGEKKEAEKDAKKTELIPTRVLGRTGEKISMLCFGAGMPEPRMFNAMYAAGIRCCDTADCYGKHEQGLGEWIKDKGCRKEMCIITKDHPKTPDDFVTKLDDRLEKLQSDYVDLFFLHGMGEAEANDKLTMKEMVEIPKLKEWGKAAEKMKKSGKAKFIGMSMHGDMDARLEMLKNSVAGGWIEAILLMYDVQLVRENKEFNKALDEAHKAGIGLISMKQMRRLHELKKNDGDQAAEAAKLLPKFKEMGLTPYQAVLQAVWTDERITSICSAMQNMDVLKDNAEAARTFKPLDKDKLGAVYELYRQFGTRYCTACDGRCRRAAGTQTAFNKIARYLAYFEADGAREHARRLFAALTPEERSWGDADLAAASQACKCRLDFAALLKRADEKLG